jgi:hypothetical protein
VWRTPTLVEFCIAARASVASLVLLAVAGATVTSPATTKWKVPLIADADTDGCCALPVACITAGPIWLKVWMLLEELREDLLRSEIESTRKPQRS